MTHVLAGNNNYLVKKRLDELSNVFINDYGELALERLDGEESSVEQIMSAIESLPFLSDKKMVVINDLSANKEAAEQLESLIEKTGDSTDLIIIEQSADKRSAYYKQLKKLKNFEELNQPNEYQLADWLLEKAKTLKAKLSKKDAEYLVQRVGVNQSKLGFELQKLAQYDTQITKDSIDLLCEEMPSTTIFNLIDSVFSGDTNKALKIYDDQRRQKVEPQAIHGMVVWQMHAVAVAAYAPGGSTSAQIAKDSGLSPFVVGKSQRIAKKMGRAKISEFFNLLRDIDYRSKHEALDYDEAMKFAILSLNN